MKQYKLVVCGATLDHFHKGHKAFLRFALNVSERVLLGLTSDRYAGQKKVYDASESYEKRRGALVSFLNQEGVLPRVTVVKIHDVFIPKTWETLPIEAIVASESTKEGARAVNDRRKQQGRVVLPILLCPMVMAQDGMPITATRIRKGEINREGRLYLQEKWLSQTLILPKTLRPRLKRPLGMLVSDFAAFVASHRLNEASLATVGDVVTKSCHELSLGQQLSVVDFCVGRKRVFASLSELGFQKQVRVLRVDNPAGHLTPWLFRAVQDIFKGKKKRQRIALTINGEEDLAVLPLVLAAPLDFTVLYGQPEEGVVVVVVSEKTKEDIFAIVSRFVPT